jgi:hypothetical protein
MQRNWTVLTVAILVITGSSSCDPETPANLMKETRNALAAKGMTVGAFEQPTDYPIAVRGREHVHCAAVLRDGSNCRICLVTYTDANAAIAAASSKLRSALPEGSDYYVRGKTIFVVEPGLRPSTTLNQEVYDAITKLP